MFDIFTKNFKIVIRSWIYLFTLIIGPLAIIFLIALTLGAQVTTFPIGVIAAEDSEILESLTQKTTVYKYSSVLDCIEGLKETKVILCIEFSENESEEKREIKIYHDNTKPGLSRVATSFVETQLEEISKEISKEAAVQLTDVLAETGAAIEGPENYLRESKKELEQTKTDLIEAKLELEEVQEDFEPRYKRIKASQPAVNENASKAVAEIEEVERILDNLLENEERVRGAIAVLHTSGYSDVAIMMEELLVSSARLRVTLPPMRQGIEQNVKDYNEMVALMDKVHVYLPQAINKTDESIIRIDNNLIKIDSLMVDLSEQKKEFQEINELKLPEVLLSPFVTLFTPIFPHFELISLFFPLILITILLFISISLTNIFVLTETHSLGYKRNLISPVKDSVFLRNTFFINLLFVFFQIFILLLVANFYFNIPVFNPETFFSVLIVFFLLAAIFIQMGMFFGYIIKSTHLSILVSSFVVIAFLFFSGLITPVEVMNPFIAFFVKLNPFVIGEALFRKIFLMNSSLFNSFGTFLPSLLKLSAYALVMVFLTTIAKKINKRIIVK